MRQLIFMTNVLRTHAFMYKITGSSYWRMRGLDTITVLRRVKASIFNRTIELKLGA